MKLDSSPGSTFTDVSNNAKNIANEKGLTVEFDFNGITCLVNSTTNLVWLARDYKNSWTMEWKTIGPYCVETYSEEIQNEYEKRNKINEEQRLKEYKEYKEKQLKQKKNFEEKVKGIELDLSDPDGWNNYLIENSDGYGKAVLDFAEGWAKLMQIEISKGKTIADCYNITQNDLDFLGITGFQFGCAISILSKTWRHGDKLQKYYKKKNKDKDKDRY